MRLLSSIVILSFLLIFVACSKEPSISSSTTLIHGFESGSIGDVAKLSNTQWVLSVKNDNNNSSLPAEWRSWWYVKFENVITDSVLEITVKNSGWPYYYVPKYSYNQVDWFHFDESEITQNSSNHLIIKKKFNQSTVWIARFYPYTFSDLERYIKTLNNKPNIAIQKAGFTQENRPIYLFKITNSLVSDSLKHRVFIHARTHPGETPPSFLIEGMVDFLLSGNATANEILNKFEFYIFPMQNADGVYAGNYRSTPSSENLEVMWYRSSVNPINLTSSAPVEVATIHSLAKSLMTDGGPKVTVALNLHGSNSEPNTRTFFFPHFGTTAQGYASIESQLWTNQLSFISNLATHHGSNLLEPVVNEGGSSFVSKAYPESWWWANFKDSVMAITMEMTYGRAGYQPRWIEPNDFRALGAALALGIRDYHNPAINAVLPDNMKMTREPLEYPNLYPPKLEELIKK